ncbi:MAG: PHP domain-containing protein [Anaerolineae bacterium]|nr:PHP domain-containing protein [Anaerolineae bacterium]
MTSPLYTSSVLTCDLHTHTSYSRDCLVSPERFLEVCRRRGLDRVAVTDHNTIAGALRLKEIDPERVIVGQEIRTTRGELIAYFLTEPIPPDLPPQEAIAAVRAQGGIVGISHPLDRTRREAMGRNGVEALLEEVDFLEGFNARCLFPADNQAALALARAYHLPVTAGSDAHSLWELGRAVVQMPPFDSPESFLEALRQARIEGRTSPAWVHILSTLVKFLRQRGLVPFPTE